jgi:hypothetical protein
VSAPVAPVVVSRRRAAAPVAVVLVLAPFFLPSDAFLARALLTGFAISVAMKIRLLWAGRDADPCMLATWPRFLIWLLVPPATIWPRTPAEAHANRRHLAPLSVRAVAAFVLLLVLVGAKRWLDARASGPWTLPVRAVLEMLEFYALLLAMTDTLTGLVRLGGIQVEPVFVHPARSRGPGEFWSLRWNRVVHRFARHEVFAPVARRGGRALAVLATFGASGLMHEYLVVAAVGLGAYRPGLMLAFFLLQALAVLFERATGNGRQGRWPPVVHVAWLAVTTPLFFRPLDPQITAFDDACLGIARTLLAPVL